MSGDIVKIGDLGISKMTDQTNQSVHTVLGTQNYMAPEMFNYETYTSKADVWSLGTLIYELCMLEPPFKSPKQIIMDQ